MPKRASCHHCMRRARSASCAGELCWGCACALVAAVLVAVASVSNDAPVPTSQSRRAMAFGVISRCPPVVTPIGLRFQLENTFHKQPLFSGLGGWKRLLKFPHEFFPCADLGICAVSVGFGVEGKALVDFHDHEHTCAEQINLHINDAGISDAGGNFRPDFLMVTAILGYQCRVILEIECEAVSFIHHAYSSRVTKKGSSGAPPSGQSTIEMYVATVDDHMLPGYVTGLCRHEEQNHSSNFVRFGHPLAERNP